MNAVGDFVVSSLAVLGGLFCLLGSLGLAKLPDVFMRLHGPSKATTLGVGSILLGSIVHFSAHQGLSLHELLITLFLFLTAPVSAHLIARAALHRRCKSLIEPPQGD